MSKAQQMTFHGIVAVGESQSAATAQYKALALGKLAPAVLVDSLQSLSFVTAASIAGDLFNPNSGEVDVSASPDLLGKVSFNAQASANQQVALTHVQCSSGCGSHVVSDSAELVKFCPVCCNSLEDEDDESESADDEEDDLNLGGEDTDADDEDSDDEGDEEEEVAEASDDEDELLNLDTDGGEDDGDEEEEDLELPDDEDESESEDDEDSADGEEEEDLELPDDEDESEDDGEDESTSSADDMIVAAGVNFDDAMATYTKSLIESGSVSANAENIDAEYCMCATCGTHLISESKLDACVYCQSEDLVEPSETPARSVSIAADDEEETEDDSDLDTSEDEEETEEDDSADEESESTSASAPNAAVDTIVYSALSSVPSDAKQADLDVAYSASVAGAPMWSAFYKGALVAIARVENAGDKKDLFGKDVFGTAVLATATHAGVATALAEFGFKPVEVAVSISQEIESRVAEKLAAHSAALNVDFEQRRSNLLSALATSAVGINRGFFNGMANPLKAALYDSMSNAGIRNPEVVIDKAFQAHADTYHKSLFDKAMEIVAQPVAVQESLAAAVQSSNYMAVSSASEANMSDASVSSVLDGGMGKPAATVAVAAKTQMELSAVAGDNSVDSMSRMQSAVANLGRRN